MNDINKLKDILSRSKAVMDKTEVDYGSTTDVASPVNSSIEKEVPNLTENYIKTHQNTSTRSVSPQNGRYRNIKNTKMPKEIVAAMIDNPIEIPENPYPTFELEQVGDLVTESTSVPTPSPTVRPKTSGVSKTTIKKIVREEMESVVRGVIEEYLDKALITEDIQIKIGSTIFSGNLKPLPKKRKTKRRV